MEGEGRESESREQARDTQHSGRAWAEFPPQLTVHDLRREAATPLLESGADWADTPGEIAAACDLVFTSLPTPREIEAVSLGEDGILDNIKPGAVYLDLSTGSPTLIREIYAKFAEKGAHVLDAPVSGGTR